MQDWSLSRLLDFLNASPTPYHAVATVRSRLFESRFEELQERDAWQLQPGGRYFFTRRDASIIAFVVGDAPPEAGGVRVVGAHTDSPTLKLKPRPERFSQGYAQAGVEIYGGVLLNPWFDRDLSLAGRVTVRNNTNTLEHHLVDFAQAVAIIPSLAIHLDRQVNEGRAVNPEEHMRPVFTRSDVFSVRDLLSAQLQGAGVDAPASSILEYDLSFYDMQPAALVGLEDEFIASARLDNLLSCQAGLEAFVAGLEASCAATRVLALFDHEEVGSGSDIGANGNMLPNLLERLAPAPEQRQRMIALSTLLSVDGAHGIHPNYPQRHDQMHGPRLNGGPVIKIDANQSYSTSSATAGLVHMLASERSTPLQTFVTRADMRCGSTIGPMSAAKTGIPTVDIGAALFAMHSIRELAGAQDLKHLSDILDVFFKV